MSLDMSLNLNGYTTEQVIDMLENQGILDYIYAYIADEFGYEDLYFDTEIKVQVFQSNGWLSVKKYYSEYNAYYGIGQVGSANCSISYYGTYIWPAKVLEYPDIPIYEHTPTAEEITQENREKNYQKYLQYDADLKRRIGQLTMNGWEILQYDSFESETEIGQHYIIANGTNVIEYRYGVDSSGNFINEKKEYYRDIETGDYYYLDGEGTQTAGVPTDYTDIPPYEVPSSVPDAPSGWEDEHDKGVESMKLAIDWTGAPELKLSNPDNVSVGISNDGGVSVPIGIPEGTRLDINADGGVELNTEGKYIVVNTDGLALPVDTTGQSLTIDTTNKSIPIDTENSNITVSGEVVATGSFDVDTTGKSLMVDTTGKTLEVDTTGKSITVSGELNATGEVINKFEEDVKASIIAQGTFATNQDERNKIAHGVEYGEDGVRGHEKAVAVNKNNIEYSDKVKEVYTDSTGEEKTIFKGYKRNKDIETKKNIERYVKDDSDNRSEVLVADYEPSEFEHEEEVDYDFGTLSPEEAEYEFIVLTNLLLNKEITKEEYEKRVSQLS